MSDLPGTLPANDEVKQSAAYRGLKAVVIILGVLIVLGLGALVTGMILKFNGKSRPASGEGETFALAPGSAIVSSEVSGSRLILRVKNETGEEIDIVDTQDGHLISRIKAAPPQVPSH
ncbi:MAG: hypothetical protein HY243_08210 [Proteobacteria bacterium]|nr:hypothetical protein [Pseudomonadota bacterium]